MSRSQLPLNIPASARVVPTLKAFLEQMANEGGADINADRLLDGGDEGARLCQHRKYFSVLDRYNILQDSIKENLQEALDVALPSLPKRIRVKSGVSQQHGAAVLIDTAGISPDITVCLGTYQC